MKNNNLLPISIFTLAICILLSAMCILYTLKTTETPETSTISNSKSLNLAQAAEYLNMTEKEVFSIIKTEQKILDGIHSFSGIMLPYFMIDDEYYFYKDGIDMWLNDSSIERREYDTLKWELYK